MSTDLTKLFLYRNNGECDILSNGRSARHAYLDKAEDKNFRQEYIHKDSDDYMPTIHVNTIHNEITSVEVQVCPSKLLYGTNIYETKEEDFKRFLPLLVKRLEYAGILTDESVLREHYLSGLDVNKPVLLPLCSPTLRFICGYNVPQPARSRKGYSVYEESDGWGVHFNFQKKGIKMYDKTAEALQQNAIPADLATLIQENGCCLINLEYTMQDKKSIDYELKMIKSNWPNTLETAFNQEVCMKILQHRMDKILDGFFTIQNDMVNNLAAINQYCDMHKELNGLQKRNALFGAVCKCSIMGYPEYYKELKQNHSAKEIRKHLNFLKSLQLPRIPEESIFKETILQALYSKDYVTENSIVETLKRYKNGNFIPPITPVIQEMDTVEDSDDAQ